MNNNELMPLKGIKVLELATVVAAPTAARILCSYGADVIKIESLSGDDMRRAGISEGVVCEDNKNPLFSVANTGKKLIAVNLKSKEGKEIFHKLIAQADVFITNVRGASLKRLGIDYDSIHEQYPKLIYAHFSAYGQKGPDSSLPGFDSTAFWLKSGPIADWMTGPRPFTPTYAFGDMATSSAFTSGILMALLGRERSGKGTFVTTSLYASGIWCNAIRVIAAQAEQTEDVDKVTDYLPADPLSDTYCCKDGVWLGVYDNEYCRDRDKFARILNFPQLAEDPRYVSLDALRSSGAMRECYERLKQIFASKTASQWQEYLSSENIACQVACSADSVSRDVQAIENGYVSKCDFSDGLSMMLPEPPVTFGDYSRRISVSVGRLGEHTDEVLASIGYSEMERSNLRQNGIII